MKPIREHRGIKIFDNGDKKDGFGNELKFYFSYKDLRYYSPTLAAALIKADALLDH